MSTSRIVTVWCDFPNCVHFYEGGETVQVTRLEAHRRGWRFRDGKDTCRTHSIFKPREWANQG